jgi:hypothetical protein
MALQDIASQESSVPLTGDLKHGFGTMVFECSGSLPFRKVIFGSLRDLWRCTLNALEDAIIG